MEITGTTLAVVTNLAALGAFLMDGWKEVSPADSSTKACYSFGLNAMKCDDACSSAACQQGSNWKFLGDVPCDKVANPQKNPGVIGICKSTQPFLTTVMVACMFFLIGLVAALSRRGTSMGGVGFFLGSSLLLWAITQMHVQESKVEKHGAIEHGIPYYLGTAAMAMGFMAVYPVTLMRSM